MFKPDIDYVVKDTDIISIRAEGDKVRVILFKKEKNGGLVIENERIHKGVVHFNLNEPKDYHSLGREIAELLKDPEAMKGLSLERQLNKLGYYKMWQEEVMNRDDVRVNE